MGPFTKQDHLEIATLGLEFATVEVLCTLGGWWLDKRWGSLPWLTLAGAVLGFAWGMYLVVKGAQTGQEQTNLTAHKADKKDGRS